MNVVGSLWVNGSPVFGGGLIGMAGSVVYFVDPLVGADVNGNQGGTASNPFATLQYAHDQTVSGRGDFVILIGGPSSDGTTTNTARLATTLTWSHNNTHLIGIGAPTRVGQRSRISTATGATANLAPLITLSGSGCMWQNLSIFQGVGQASTDEKMIDVTGSRNAFWNVGFQGMGSANGAARSGSYTMKITGGENTFEHCTLGVETEPRSAANATVILTGTGAQRNSFHDCWFQMYPTATTPLFVSANATNVLNGSTMLFKNCTFGTLKGAGGYLQPSVTITLAADANGCVMFDRCATGAAAWSVTNANVLSSNPTASGTGGLLTSVS